MTSFNEDDIGKYLNLQNNRNETPLILACEGGYNESSLNAVIQILKSKKININLTDNDGTTAFMKAVENNHKDIVEYMVNEYKDIGKNKMKDVVNIATNSGETPFSYLCYHGYYPMALKIYNMGNINVNHINKQKETPLLQAVQSNYSESYKDHYWIDLIDNEKEQKLLYNLPDNFWKNGNIDGICIYLQKSL